MPDVIKISDLPEFTGEIDPVNDRLVILDNDEAVLANKVKKIEPSKIVTSTNTILQAVYPVGSIFISVVSTNPATLLGIGTWTAFGTGRTLVGIDTGQTEFDTVKETGGAKTHTLSTNEMPAHTHTISTLGTAPDAGGNVGTRYFNSGTKTTNSTGGGQAHNNLQPYIVVYMWERTA